LKEVPEMKRYDLKATSGRLISQRGVVLFMTLIALVAMTLAAIALVRSVDTGNLVAGNVALKQGASQESEKGMNLAYTCLDNGGTLFNVSKDANRPICNYYSTLQTDTVKPYGIPDILDSPSLPVMQDNTATTGNKITFVIERLCAAGTVAWDDKTCITSPFGRTPPKGDQRLPPPVRPPQALYRISVKVYGPRSVASYTQMVMNAGI
jgi:type IV pilus assembly protein PilX